MAKGGDDAAEYEQLCRSHKLHQKPPRRNHNGKGGKGAKFSKKKGAQNVKAGTKIKKSAGQSNYGDETKGRGLRNGKMGAGVLTEPITVKMLKRMKVRLYMIKGFQLILVSKYWIYMIGTPSVMKNNRSALGTLLVHRIATSMYVDGTTPPHGTTFLRRMLSSELGEGSTHLFEMCKYMRTE